MRSLRFQTNFGNTLRILNSRPCKAINNSKRKWSTSSDKVIVEKDSGSGIAMVYMNYAPVNVLDNSMMRCFSHTIKAVEADPEIKGIILTSNFHGKVFCAGLNIYDMYQKPHEHVKQLWWDLQELHLTLFGCKKPVVASINGHAPAGGCAVSLMCDYRVMQKGANKLVGLNEVVLGVVPTYSVCDLMIRVVGQRESERALVEGKLFSAEEAAECGLVNEICDLEDINERARKAVMGLMTITTQAYAATKMIMREKHLNYLRQIRDEETESFATRILSSETQKNLGRYLESLAGRK